VKQYISNSLISYHPGVLHIFQIKLRDPVYDLLKHGVTLGKICMDDIVGWMRVKGAKPFSLALGLYLSF
jgi:hypothetical protein